MSRPGAGRSAGEAGRAIGAVARAQADDTGDEAGSLAAALETLDAYGFSPRAEGDGYALGNCPFHALSAQLPEVACRMNHALIASALDAAGARTASAHLEPAEGRCCVTVRPAHGEPGVLPGHLREALGHCARRAQRHVNIAVPADREPAGDHRAMVAYPKVVGVGDGARAFAGTLRPASHGAPGFPYRPHSRVVGELVECLGRHRRGSFCPFGGHRRGGLPGSEELPSWVISGGTHHCIVSPGQAGDQQSFSLCAKTVITTAQSWPASPWSSPASLCTAVGPEWEGSRQIRHQAATNGLGPDDVAHQAARSSRLLGVWEGSSAKPVVRSGMWRWELAAMGRVPGRRWGVDLTHRAFRPQRARIPPSSWDSWLSGRHLHTP